MASCRLSGVRDPGRTGPAGPSREDAASRFFRATATPPPAAAATVMAAALRLVANGTVDLDGLAAADAERSTPWLLERHGFLMAPEVASL